MCSPIPKPSVAVSKSGDLLIIQGPAQPALFVSRAQVSTLLENPDRATAIMIVDVGVAAIRTVLATGATFDAVVNREESGSIRSITLRFALPNGLTVGYTNDDDLASDSDRLHRLGIDLVVTDSAIDWQRQHTQFVGQVISAVSTTPSQVIGFSSAAHRELAPIIREVLQRTDSAAISPQSHPHE